MKYLRHYFYSIAIFLTFTMGESWALCKIQPGDLIANQEMQRLNGSSTHLLKGEKANVILFFRPDQVYSQAVAKKMAQILEPEMKQKSVSFVSVVSDRFEKVSVNKFVAESGIKMPVLIDKGDAVLGALGLILQPTVLIVDQENKLNACQHFEEINMIEVIRGRIRYLLGEITDKELQEIIAPSQQQQNDNHNKALLRLSLAKSLFAKNKLEQALDEVQKCKIYDATIGEAYSLTGKIYLKKGDCENARQEFTMALKINPNDSDAIEGLKRCP